MVDLSQTWRATSHYSLLSSSPSRPQLSSLQLRYQSVCEGQQCAAVRNEALLQDVRRLKQQLSLGLAVAQTSQLETLKVRIVDYM